jgi:hypothetical protein
VRLVREERPPVVADPDLLRVVEILDRRISADAAATPHADVRQQAQKRRVQIRPRTQVMRVLEGRRTDRRRV